MFFRKKKNKGKKREIFAEVYASPSIRDEKEIFAVVYASPVIKKTTEKKDNKWFSTAGDMPPYPKNFEKSDKK